MIKLLADAKIGQRRSRMLKRFVWSGRVAPKPRTGRVGHVYRIYDSGGKVVGEYTSLKGMAKHAFNGALSREELVARMRHKLKYNGCTIVKEQAPDTPRFYQKLISIPASMVSVLEVLSAHLGKPAGTLMREAITTFVNQEVEKLPDHLKEHL